MGITAIEGQVRRSNLSYEEWKTIRSLEMLEIESLKTQISVPVL